jgi:phytoene synthase
MGSMPNETNPLSKSQWAAIDKRVRKVDEDRWISSRYAPAAERRALTALYALAYELARVRLAVSEETLGLIRFQWWREALTELDEGKPPREHDVCLAIAEETAAGRLKPGALQRLVDGYEASFIADNRAKDPEAWLALIAASVLTTHHDWAEEIRDVAPAYAALRRSETKAFGPHVKLVPKSIRPAVAHYRLRRHYSETGEPNAVSKRLSILKAIRTGQV